jgi:hypothetical protein
MKSNLVARSLTLTAILLFSLSAFAGTGNFTVLEDTTVQGKTLKAGEYKAKWSDDGQLTIYKNNKEVMTAQGRVVEKEQASQHNAVVKQNDADGSSRVLELRFAGKKTALVLDGDSVAKKQ